MEAPHDQAPPAGTDGSPSGGALSAGSGASQNVTRPISQSDHRPRPHDQNREVELQGFPKAVWPFHLVRAPQLFLTILTRKAESAGGQVVEFNTRTPALSQVCLCGPKPPKRLSERVHACDCGITMQRDLFSAYLARFVKDDTLQVAKANASWPGAEPFLRLGNRPLKTNLQVEGGSPRPLASFRAVRVRVGRPRRRIC